MQPGVRHLRPRDGGQQDTTAVELFFDLVYVLAVTQLSHLLIDELTWTGAARAGVLLVVVWWAWIYTTWMVNWFDPESALVRLVLVGVMLASLLMAATVPGAFGGDGLLFAGAYVALQVGRNVGGAVLLPRGHPLRGSFERFVAWSLASAPLWLAGGLADAGARPWLWAAALALDLVAPLADYWVPGRGRAQDTGVGIEGGHFAERLQGFLIIALGESIVITGATAAAQGLTATVTAALAVAFLETAALWWLYFGEVAVRSHRLMTQQEDAMALARDAYTYLHVPIVAGVIVSAVGDDLLLARPTEPLGTAGILVVLGGPVLFLGGELLFRLRMIRSVNPKRVLALAGLVLLGALAPFVSALATAGLVTALLAGLGAWEARRTAAAVRAA